MADLLIFLDKVAPPVAIFVLLVFLLRKPIGGVLLKLTTSMDKHFSSRAITGKERADFEHAQELETTRARLNESERTQLLQKQILEFDRELIMKSLDFSQHVLLDKVEGVEARLTEAEQKIIQEINEIKAAVDKISNDILADKKRQKTKTREMLLDKIGGDK